MRTNLKNSRAGHLSCLNDLISVCQSVIEKGMTLEETNVETMLERATVKRDQVKRKQQTAAGGGGKKSPSMMNGSILMISQSTTKKTKLMQKKTQPCFRDGGLLQ